jgi:hypothetical protein
MLYQFKVEANWGETAYRVLNSDGFSVNANGERTGLYIGLTGPRLPEQWFASYDEAHEIAIALHWAKYRKEIA